MTNTKSKAAFFLVLVSAMTLRTSDAAAQSLTLDGVLASGGGYTVYLVEQSGRSVSSRVAPSGKFSFKKVTKARLKGASLQLSDADGRYAGPIVLAGSGSKVATSFSGKLLSTKQKKLALGRISLKAGYAQPPALWNTLLFPITFNRPRGL
jgi:hypothetical protein